MLGFFFLLLALFPYVEQEKGCSRCKHRGVTDCKKHTRVERELEATVKFCSVVADCACEGTFLLDCSRCEGGPESAAREARREAIARWRQKDRLERHLGRLVPRVETEHFQLVVDCRPLPNGKKKMKAHAFLHLLGQDVEEVATLVNRHFRITGKDYKAKMRMWIWGQSEDHRSVLRKFLTSSATGDYKMLGMDPVFSVWTEGGLFDTVPKVRSLFIHNASHLLLSNAFHPEWVGDMGGGWLDAGAGHWYEYAALGRTLNYCIEEAYHQQDYHGGRWRAAIRKRLEREKKPVLPEVWEKATGVMRLEEQALCWSFFDYLVANQQSSLQPLLRGIKGRKPLRPLLEEHLGMNLLQAEEAWREWVKSVYPRKGDKPRTAD